MPNPWNTNIVSPENDLKLEESIRRNGLFKPIIVREVSGSLQIIGGEHRWQAAQNVGMVDVPIVNLGPIDDHRAKEIGVIDNSRYGDDDALSFAELLKELGSADDLKTFLPYADDDLTTIFSVSNIALDTLEIDENLQKVDPDDEIPEPAGAKAPKTHTIMRFKVSNKDAELLTALISKTQKAQGLNLSDDLTNAGDAIVYLLSGQFVQPAAQPTIALEDIDDLIAEVNQ